MRFGACLALVALALNLAFAFGHHHFDDIRSGHEADLADGAPDAGDEDSEHDSAAAHACLTCAVVTAAPIAAGAPVLPARVRTANAAVAAIAGFELQGEGRTAFEARAPPRS